MKTVYSILVFILTYNSVNFAQLSGIKTVGTGGDYETIQAAISALNSSEVGAGGVTFNIAAGHTENITSIISLTATGSFSNPIIFQKSGTGNNPKIIRTDEGEKSTSVIGGDGDAIIKLEGSDYVTFDGLDIQANQSSIEYGYMLSKPNGTNGCNNVTIKNCTITMNKNSSYVIGIYVSNGPTSTSSNAGVTVSSDDGRNQNITIISNTIQNVYNGIYCLGYNNSSYYDNNITIGQISNGNTIQNYGGGSSIAYGICFIYNNNPTASYNTITSSTNSSNLYGILFDKQSFQNENSGNIVANNNNITLSNSSGTTSFIYNKNAVTSETYNSNTFSSGTISSGSTTYLIYADNSTSNKTISGNQTSGNFITSGSLYCYYNSNGPFGSGTEEIFNNNFSNLQAGSSSSLIGIYAIGSYATRNCYNNSLSNWTGGSGSTVGIYSTSSSQSNIYSNSINNISAGGTIYGIYSGGSNIILYLNTLHTFLTSGSAVVGVNYDGYGTSHLYRNQIFNISANGSSSIRSYGIYYNSFSSYSSFNLYIYNNFISDLKAPNSSITDNAVAGMYFSQIGGTNDKFLGIYFNTIFLNASSSGTNFGSSGIYSHSGNNLDLRNNIIVNNSSSAGLYKTIAFRRSSSSLSTYSSNSDGNCFYAGTPGENNLIYYDGTNSDQTINEFKTRVFPRDEISFSEFPPFINSSSAPYNLHINSGTVTRVESGGVPITSPISVNTDIDENSRHSYYPDAGADEGTFTLQDENPPYISYTAMGTGANGTTRAFNNVIIVDPSNINTSSGTAPRVYYKKSTENNTYIGNTSLDNGWKWVEGTQNGGVFNFTIDYTKLTGGGVTPGDTIQYFVVAQDLASTPHVKIKSGTFNSQPSSVNLTTSAFPITGTINSYGILQSVSGEILVGYGKTFTSLTGNNSSGLFKAINNRVVTGDVNVKITSDIQETGEVALNESLKEVQYTISIKSNDSIPKIIYGNAVNGLITFNGADKVTIDGTFNNNNKCLIFRNTNTSAPVFTFISGASQDTVRNIYIEGATASDYNGAVFFSSGSNENNFIQNCFIKSVNNNLRPKYAVYFEGSSNTSNNILSNEIYDFLSAGIYLKELNGGLIEKNHIYLVNSSASNSVNGILISNSGTGILRISKNKIDSLQGSSSSNIKGIYLESSFTNNKLSIENNSIILSPVTTGTVDGIDIALYASDYVNIYYNSVYLNGSLSSGSSNSFAIRKTQQGGTLNLKNNVFYNSRYNNDGSGSHYAIYFSNTSGILNLNYNDYYVSGSGTVLSYWSNSNQNSLANWQSASGQDANSISISPEFTSTLNLKPLSSSPLISAGNPISGITTDIDDVNRNSSTPTIGAYESSNTKTSFNWCNLHDPATANKLEGEGLTVTAKVYKEGVTNGSGQGSGITAWIGYNNQNTNPNTWTNWIEATYNGDNNENDVYTARIGASLAPGTYYFASRFLIQNGQYVYGGYSTEGGGFWNGTSYVSGTLTITQNNIPNITIIPPVTPPDYPSIKRRNSSEFRGRLEVTNVTTQDFESSGISMYIVFNTQNTNPNTWPSSNSVKAEYVGRVDGNMHEYKADVGSDLDVGTYYVATKSVLPSGTTQYGGYSSSGGGIWNGTTNVSTRLDVTSNTSSEPNSSNIVHPPITPNNLNAVTKVNNTIWGIGDYGTLVKSTNGGSSFSTKHKIDGFDGKLYGLDFISESIGYVSGVDNNGNGVFGKTTDGGENWNIFPIKDTDNNIIDSSTTPQSVATLESGKIIVAKNSIEGTGHSWLESTDGGTTWIEKSGSYPNINFNKIRKFGTNDVWAVGNGGIVSYDNSSGSWGGPSATGAPSNVNFKDIAKNSSGKLVAIGNGKIYVSTNGGSSWEEKFNVGVELNSVRFFTGSDTKICVVGRNGVGLYSMDGGNTWGFSVWADAFNPNVLNDIVNTDSDNALFVGNSGTIGKTTNAGQTFSNAEQRAFNGNNYSIQEPSPNNLLVANDDGLFKSTNQGSNWNKINLPNGFSGKITDIKMVNSLVGFAVSPINNSIFKTTDGGNTWTLIRQEQNPVEINKLHIVDQNKIIASAMDIPNNNRILVSTDGGNSWTERTVNDFEKYTWSGKLLSLTDNKNGTLVATLNSPSGGYLGNINSLVVSTDFGETWQTKFYPPGYLNSVSFSNQYNGIAVGAGGVVYTTSDGGQNWTRKEVFSSNIGLQKVEHLSTNVAVATDYDGGLWYSSNNGDSWKKMETNTNKPIKDINKTGSVGLNKIKSETVSAILVGEDGLVIKSTDELLPVELFSLYAKVTNNNVLLLWQTATEVNNYGFEIERTIENGKLQVQNWEKIGFVTGHGNSNSPKDYSFIDKNPKSGKNKYRLKQIDFDGKYEYSEVVEVSIDLPTKFVLEQNYPNPFNPTTMIKYSIPSVGEGQALAAKVTLKVYDILGREVATLVNEKQLPGNYEVKFNASNLASGIYFYKLNTNSGYQMIRKMILVK